MVGWGTVGHQKQRIALGASFCVTVFLLVTRHRADYHSAPVSLYERSIQHAAAGDLHTRQGESWRALYNIMISHDPLCDTRLPVGPVSEAWRERYNPEYDQKRPDNITISTADLQRLKTAHANFVKDIHVSMTAKLVYDSDTRGVVFTVPDTSLAVLTFAITMLRKSGSHLPVEVFLDRPTRYIQHYCSHILHPLNAQCRYFSDVLTASTAAITPHTYQYKILAITFSSFEDVLFLDYDAWPITCPDPLFHTSPFNITGLILWPDFWFPSESHYFFQIAGLDRIPRLMERASTESGVLMYNKKKHHASLLLVTYYNFYGPDYYFHLLSQGASGEGDKETFGMAALAMHEDFYTVQQNAGAVGRWTNMGDFFGIGIVQHDAVHDFLNTNVTARQEVQRVRQSSNPMQPEGPNVILPKPSFLHANHPKMNPWELDDGDENSIRAAMRNEDGAYTRLWGSRESTIARFGEDLEANIWGTIRTVTCDTLRGIGLPSDRHDQGGLKIIRERERRVCGVLDEYIERVFRGPGQALETETRQVS